jgi:anti-anti-sigma factor
MKLTLTTRTTSRAAHVTVAGDLEYGSTDQLVDTVCALIAERPYLGDLHLDFGELTFCDSAGLSGLLLIHRRTSAAGMHLHLENRTAQLDRILDITGLLEFLTARPARSLATPQTDSELG